MDAYPSFHVSLIWKLDSLFAAAKFPVPSSREFGRKALILRHD
jgi:hypothetical protein